MTTTKVTFVTTGTDCDSVIAQNAKWAGYISAMCDVQGNLRSAAISLLNDSLANNSVEFSTQCVRKAIDLPNKAEQLNGALD